MATLAGGTQDGPRPGLHDRDPGIKLLVPRPGGPSQTNAGGRATASSLVTEFSAPWHCQSWSGSLTVTADGGPPGASGPGGSRCQWAAASEAALGYEPPMSLTSETHNVSLTLLAAEPNCRKGKGRWRAGRAPACAWAGANILSGRRPGPEITCPCRFKAR